MLNIKTNSKEVKKNDIFIALKGITHDGHDYITEAIKNGAAKIICERGSYDVETILVGDTNKYLKEYLYNNYYKKIKNLKLIGVTGTNGKTTTCYLIYQALNKLNKKCAYIGTIGFYMDKKIKDLERTTPEMLDIYDMLLKCVENNIEYVVMEVSSHSLELSRLDTILFDMAIFTNLTRDHLDFHKTFDNYAKAKHKLFNKLKNNGLSIINCDDKYYKSIENEDNNNIYYGTKSSNYKLLKYKFKDFKTIFEVSINNQKYVFETNLIGKYNIYNLMSVIIVLDKLKFDINLIQDTILSLVHPPGRMDTIIYNNNLIAIDYAHTPDAIFNAISSIKEYTNGKIYSIIGCGGNRDKTKRKLMTFYATILSNKVIITSDNPRFEDINDIVRDMTLSLAKDNYEIITDRKEAIIHGINLLNNNDVLLILGKGHETYQVIGDKKYYHSDKEFVLDYIDRVI